MNTKIVSLIADYINAYENYENKVGLKNTQMKELTDTYYKILNQAEKYSDNYEKFISTCNRKNLFVKFQKYSGELKKILIGV